MRDGGLGAFYNGPMAWKVSPQIENLEFPTSLDIKVLA